MEGSKTIEYQLIEELKLVQINLNHSQDEIDKRCKEVLAFITNIRLNGSKIEYERCISDFKKIISLLTKRHDKLKKIWMKRDMKLNKERYHDKCDDSEDE